MWHRQADAMMTDHMKNVRGTLTSTQDETITHDDTELPSLIDDTLSDELLAFLTIPLQEVEQQQAENSDSGARDQEKPHMKSDNDSDGDVMVVEAPKNPMQCTPTPCPSPQVPSTLLSFFNMVNE